MVFIILDLMQRVLKKYAKIRVKQCTVNRIQKSMNQIDKKFPILQTKLALQKKKNLDQHQGRFSLLIK